MPAKRKKTVCNASQAARWIQGFKTESQVCAGFAPSSKASRLLAPPQGRLTAWPKPKLCHLLARITFDAPEGQPGLCLPQHPPPRQSPAGPHSIRQDTKDQSPGAW